MRIALDARAIYQTCRRGTGKNLIDLYRRLSQIRPAWEFLLFHQTDGSDDPFSGAAGLEHRRIDIRGDRYNFWQQVRLPLAARGSRADVLHCPANTAPRWPLVPMVLTIHDLIPLDPEFPGPERQAWGLAVARAARTARRILTPSEYTKAKIVQEFAVLADKVVVSPWAPDSRCRRVTDPAELRRVRTKYGVESDRPYVFGFGAADPRKNTRRLLQAWKELPEPLRREYTLLVVGFQERAKEAFRQEVKDLGVQASCRLYGFADENDLPSLISGAAVLVYPSLSEGFGLPILDAFACETPVLSSSATSLPEVAGDAALFVDPRDAAAIARGLADLLNDEKQRAWLVSRGRTRLEHFTWDACAKRAACVFEDVAGGRN